MNLLIDALPYSLEVGGAVHKIRTSFRDCIRAMVACEDNTLTPVEKQVIVLANIYYETPADVKDALERATWFLDGGKENDGGSGVRLFSFDKDAGLIFAAFRQTHGIDLSKADLHWWEFLALFMDLGSETAFCQLTALRSRVKKGKATREERQSAREMGDVFDVPDIDDRTIEEREAEEAFMKAIGQ